MKRNGILNIVLPAGVKYLYSELLPKLLKRRTDNGRR